MCLLIEFNQLIVNKAITRSCRNNIDREAKIGNQAAPEDCILSGPLQPYWARSKRYLFRIVHSSRYNRSPSVFAENPAAQHTYNVYKPAEFTGQTFEHLTLPVLSLVLQRATNDITTACER